MNCLYGYHFQHDRLIPSLWREQGLRIRLFESKSVSTERAAFFSACSLFNLSLLGDAGAEYV
jgi:hypothetical protein